MTQTLKMHPDQNNSSKPLLQKSIEQNVTCDATHWRLSRLTAETINSGASFVAWTASPIASQPGHPKIANNGRPNKRQLDFCGRPPKAARDLRKETIATNTGVKRMRRDRRQG